MDETREPAAEAGGEGQARPPSPPRVANLVIVAGAVVLIGLVAFALYRNGHPAPPGAPAVPAVTPAPSPAGDNTAPGTPISAPVPVRLSPEASIIAERYRCVCSCNDPLNVCTCTKTPGSHDMRQYVQELVDQKKSGAEVDAAMIVRYGANVLIPAASPPPAATPTPAPARTKRKH